MQLHGQEVIARLASGLVIRGVNADFNPERPTFRVTPSEGGRGVELKVRDLKALFFLKRPPGSTDLRRAPGWVPPPDPVRDGKKIAVSFQDGETMVGYTLGYRREKVGFYFYPAADDNPNERVWICAAAVADVKVGAAAEVAVDSREARRREAA